MTPGFPPSGLRLLIKWMMHAVEFKKTHSVSRRPGAGHKPSPFDVSYKVLLTFRTSSALMSKKIIK